MLLNNQMKLEFLSIPANVAFARVTVAAFASQIECTLSDLEEIKVAVSEAVENSIIHGYENAADRFIRIYAALTEDTIEIRIEDDGRGIEDIGDALQPAFSTDSERLGLGFTFINSFMDSFKVDSTPGHGTVVTMSKRVGSGVARISPEQ
ncbi:MAG: Anti-sigma F factor [Pelotomaculum sp. PtaB.Bin013]|uniref:Anti-sigma F factor n=1 Tax=Pelotomaculum isophthalicicum JI TaxID=947010 RepID=A0A9X4H2N8_9FIRM|nr:anti-sigma F factor [Pelotomaculum isophthalicicum]MDF9409051.1 anti-sigma F factor [Pelotomaculum isophthalicicum JI]OPX82900.1 MAG: Anti-sigma F factor [Pelotomaculum sp. PtaB.Bin013]